MNELDKMFVVRPAAFPTDITALQVKLYHVTVCVAKQQADCIKTDFQTASLLCV